MPFWSKKAPTPEPMPKEPPTGHKQISLPFRQQEGTYRRSYLRDEHGELVNSIWVMVIGFRSASRELVTPETLALLVPNKDDLYKMDITQLKELQDILERSAIRHNQMVRLQAIQAMPSGQDKERLLLKLRDEIRESRTP